MRRIASGVLLIALLGAGPAAADPKPVSSESGSARISGKSNQAVKSRSTTKRVLWTVAGAGAGFAAGVFIGLNKFDDALYSDRKVWTSAIVGAAAGGVAGALLSRNTARSVPVARTVNPTPAVNVSWAEALHGPPGR
jgi:hypothetical protein